MVDVGFPGRQKQQLARLQAVVVLVQMAMARTGEAGDQDVFPGAAGALHVMSCGCGKVADVGDAEVAGDRLPRRLVDNGRGQHHQSLARETLGTPGKLGRGHAEDGISNPNFVYVYPRIFHGRGGGFTVRFSANALKPWPL